jgi:hypothetical protein
MSTKLSLKEVLERQAEWRDAPPEPSVSLTPTVWIKPIYIPRTISLAMAMMDFGVRLKVAHDAINRLAARETIAVAIPGDVAAIAAALEPYGVAVTAYDGAVAPLNAS